MGREAECTARIGTRTVAGRLLLETDDLIFRGPERWRTPLRGLTARAVDGWLVVAGDAGEARFELGHRTESWAHAINHPRTRIDKLGVTPASRVLVIGLEGEAGFMKELHGRTSNVDAGGRKKGYNVVFLRVEASRDLHRIAALSKRIDPAGGIWLIHPKGRPDLSHEVLVDAGKAAGLIDNKTARFSDTHTGLRFVIPKARR